MSKFCGNCGAQMSDDVRVCGNCGTPFAGVANHPNQSVIPGIDYEDPEKKAKRRKFVKMGLLAVVLIVVASVAYNTITSYTGYNGVVREIMKAYEEYDIDALVEMGSDVYFLEENENFAEEYFSSQVAYDLDYFELEVGHDFELSYEIKDAYTLSERKTEELLEELEYTYEDFDRSFIEEVVVIQVAVKAKESSSSRFVTVDRGFYLTSENGEWRLLYMNW